MSDTQYCITIYVLTNILFSWETTFRGSITPRNQE